MKKIVLAIGLVLLLTGCIHQVDKRPNLSDDEVWVCEYPRAEFYWNKDSKKKSTLYIDDEKHYIKKPISPGGVMLIYDEKEAEKIEKDIIITCEADFKGDRFDLTVIEDHKNLFHGFRPVLHFYKENRASYLKKIGEEP